MQNIDLVLFIVSKGVDLKFNSKIYANNKVYLNDRKFENINLNALYSALVQNYLLVYKKTNTISEAAENNVESLLLEVPELTAKTFKNNPGVLLNWAKSSDWEGRTAKQIIEEEIF